MNITKHDVQCTWDGTLAGVLLKSETVVTGEFVETTTKIIAIHGWLDNLNSLLPLAKQLVDRHPNYEIYLYDRAGHGFSSHLPKGFDYSSAQHMQDLRTITKTLGWNKAKFCIIGHSYGAILGLMYAASYPEEISCVVAIDTFFRTEISSVNFFEVQGSRIDANLVFYNRPPRTFDADLTLEKVSELMKFTRPGITEDAARLLAERSVRRNTNNKLHFSHDESLKLLTLVPFTNDMIQNALERIKASVLLIAATKSQWPVSEELVASFKRQNSNFEVTLIDGAHHLHMTHVKEVTQCIEEYFNKHLPHRS